MTSQLKMANFRDDLPEASELAYCLQHDIAGSEVKLQSGNFILLLLYYPPYSVCILIRYGVVCCTKKSFEKSLQ